MFLNRTSGSARNNGRAVGSARSHGRNSSEQSKSRKLELKFHTRTSTSGETRIDMQIISGVIKERGTQLIIFSKDILGQHKAGDKRFLHL